MRATFCFAVCISAVTLGCGKSSDKADSAANAAVTPAPAPPPPAPISLATVAGKWQVRATPQEGKDTSATMSVLTATADTTGWTMTFPSRKPIPVHVRTDGDSVMIHTGPYSSVRRKGVQVKTDGVFRLQDGKLVGMTVAHYSTNGADSVLHLRTEGTKAP
jgi:hypothetical protein